MADSWGLRLCSIFTDCRNLQKAFDQANNDINWRCKQLVVSLKASYNLNNITFVVIPRAWNDLAIKGRDSHRLSLYY